MYGRFLLVVRACCVTDIRWGFIENAKLARVLFADTTACYIAMAAGMLYRVQYTVLQLEEKNGFGRILVRAGRTENGDGSEPL